MEGTGRDLYTADCHQTVELVLIHTHMAQVVEEGKHQSSSKSRYSEGDYRGIKITAVFFNIARAFEKAVYNIASLKTILVTCNSHTEKEVPVLMP